MAVTVREADLGRSADAEAFVALTDAYARDPMGGGKALAPGVRAALVAAARRHGGLRVLLAFDGERPVGVLTVVLSFSTFAAKPVANVHDVAVAGGDRSRGVGSALLSAAEALARRLGCSKMSLEVLPENPAKRLYARAGYRFAAEFWTKELP